MDTLVGSADNFNYDREAARYRQGYLTALASVGAMLRNSLTFSRRAST